MPNIIKLDLSNNKIKKIPSKISELKIAILDLSNNRISSLPDEVGKIQNLVMLNLYGNNFTDESIEEIINKGWAKGCIYGDCNNGFGICFYDDGGNYHGDFTNGSRSGVGEYKFSDGAIYKGDFKNGAFEGYGKYYNTDGTVLYDGNFKNYTKEGRGTFYNYDENIKYTKIYKDGLEEEYISEEKIDPTKNDVYCISGDCVNGFGTYKTEISTYVGNFEGGKKNGYGEEINILDYTYKGNWVDDFQDGYGISYYPNGNISYKGGHKRSIREGKGEFFDKDTKAIIYSGDIENNLAHGIGTIYLKDGRIYNGEVKNNTISGNGTISYPSGGYLIGEFRSWTVNGLAKLYSESGLIIYDGLFKDNEFHGEGKLYNYNDKIITTGRFENSILVATISVIKMKSTASTPAYYKSCKGDLDIESCIKKLFEEKYRELEKEGFTDDDLFEICASETRTIYSEYGITMAVQGTLMNSVVPKNKLVAYLNHFSEDERKVIKSEAQKIINTVTEEIRQDIKENPERYNH